MSDEKTPEGQIGWQNRMIKVLIWAVFLAFFTMCVGGISAMLLAPLYNSPQEQSETIDAAVLFGSLAFAILLAYVVGYIATGKTLSHYAEKAGMI